MTRQVLPLTVNGRAHEVLVEPRKTLADVLREDLELTGTHLGCEHGVCGACTVLVDGLAVRSCLMLGVQAAGTEVTTIEGLERDGEMHPLQEAFRDSHSFQCGFCTPGFVMTALALLEEGGELSEAELREEMSGNICRCTGYQSIIEGVKLAAERMAVNR
jgi:aerobic-type carbon monoxide dehydrogenase small subunit (CoxS/CutS family)